MNNKIKQSTDKMYNREILTTHKRIVPKLVKWLNDNQKLSINGCEYNYHKVYQVLVGRWEDPNVDMALSTILVDIKKSKLEQLMLNNQLTKIEKKIKSIS